MKTTIKEKKTIGQMTYWEFVKEGGKFVFIFYAIIGVIYGAYLLVSTKISNRSICSGNVEADEEIITEDVTYDED